MAAVAAQGLLKEDAVAPFQKLQPHRHVGNRLVAAALSAPIVVLEIGSPKEHGGRLSEEVFPAEQRLPADDLAIKHGILCLTHGNTRRIGIRLQPARSVDHGTSRRHELRRGILAKCLHHLLDLAIEQDIVVHQPLQVLALCEMLKQHEVLLFRLCLLVSMILQP